MLRYLADEDFDNRILRVFRRSAPEIDWTRVQDIGLSGCDDASILRFAAQDQRVVLTCDVSTMTATAYRLLQNSESMTGLIVMPRHMSIGHAAHELIFLAKESDVDEWFGQVLFLPL